MLPGQQYASAFDAERRFDRALSSLPSAQRFCAPPEHQPDAIVFQWTSTIRMPDHPYQSIDINGNARFAASFPGEPIQPQPSAIVKPPR
jgi:hypothetical protein